MKPEFSTNGLQEWEMTLINTFPLIFKESDKDTIEYLGEEEYIRREKNNENVNLRFGFEFGENYAPLVYSFCENITDLIIKARETDENAFVHSFIFKEKFGTLRFQGNCNLTGEFRDTYCDLVNQLEKDSEDIWE